MTRRALIFAMFAAGLPAVGLDAQLAPRAAGDRSAASTDREADVEVQARLDRTAVWVADRFTYTIQLTCRHGVDVLTEDLGRDKLRLDGPDIVSADEPSREDRGNGVTAYRFTYHMTTYRLDPAQRIGDLSVRYYVKRPGQRLEDAAPAGEVQIPGVLLAVRSLLPDAQETATFRDARPPAPRRARFALLQPIGVGLVLVSVVPATLWAAVLVGRARSRRVHRSARQVRHEERASLDTLRSIDLASESGQRAAYDQVSALVRQHLRDACGVPADGLTPAEIGAALSARGNGAPVDLVTSLLGTCERARYGGFGGSHPSESADACRLAIDQAEQVIATVR